MTEKQESKMLDALLVLYIANELIGLVAGHRERAASDHARAGGRGVLAGGCGGCQVARGPPGLRR